MFQNENKEKNIFHYKYITFLTSYTFSFSFSINCSRAINSTQLSISNAAYINNSRGDNEREESSNTYSADNDNRYIETNAPEDAYACVDRTPFKTTKKLEYPYGDNGKKPEESQGGPGDGPVYFQLERDDKKEDEMGVDGSQEYDRLDRASKPGNYHDYHQNEDEGAYQHIQRHGQATSVDYDQDSQHLNRDGFQ